MHLMPQSALGWMALDFGLVLPLGTSTLLSIDFGSLNGKLSHSSKSGTRTTQAKTHAQEFKAFTGKDSWRLSSITLCTR